MLYYFHPCFPCLSEVNQALSARPLHDCKFQQAQSYETDAPSLARVISGHKTGTAPCSQTYKPNRREGAPGSGDYTM